MKIELESTLDVADWMGIPVRLWRGHTEAGSEVVALIVLVGIAGDEPVTDLSPREFVVTP